MEPRKEQIMTSAVQNLLHRNEGREIPREQWQEVLSELTWQLRGCRATIEVHGRDAANGRIGHGLPLQALSFETRGSEAGDLLIEAGDSPNFYFVHHVDAPRALRVIGPDESGSAELRAESADGSTTVVRLRTVAAPIAARHDRTERGSMPWILLSAAAALGFGAGVAVGCLSASAVPRGSALPAGPLLSRLPWRRSAARE
jgi:hypothetical protein